ncbi:MAG TPA: GNAT family N-acetyltransferase [Polyangia bacterium]
MPTPSTVRATEQRPAAPATLRAEVLRTPAQWSDASVVAAWTELCRRYSGLEVLFQSPEWFAHLGQVEPEAGRRVIVVRDQTGAIVALGALAEEQTRLGLDIGAHTLGAFHFRSLALLGGQPLAPPDRAVLAVFLAALVDELADDQCLLMPRLAQGGLFHRVAESIGGEGRFFTYAPAIAGGGLIHSLALRSTFAAYEREHFSGKQRGNMRRRLKSLERELGSARLRRFSAPDEVAPFLADARAVSQASWQFATVGPHFERSEDWERKLGDLARRGVLRSYVLYAGERPVAFVLGYQRSDVFYHVKTGYDRSLSRLAPGIALLCLVLEELGETGRPQRVHFMFGDTDYKRDFADQHVPSDELMLLPRTLGNVVRCRVHADFRAAVTFARDRIRRLAPLKRAAARPAPPLTVRPL